MLETKGHNPVLIANYFIDLKPPNLTLLKLIKLCYIAHGFTLALLDKPLSNEPADAWEHGPVFPSVYEVFKREYREFKEVMNKRFCESANFTEKETIIMKSVCEKYGSRDAWVLSAITHSKDGPWDKTRRKGHTEITNDLIKNHYKKILNISE